MKGPRRDQSKPIRRQSGNTAGGAALDFTALLLDTLGFTDDEFVSLGYEDTDGVFHTAVMSPTDAVVAADKLPRTANVFFGVNPVRGPARKNSGRGKEADITRLAALPVDLDIKSGGCSSRDVADAIIANLGIRLGVTRPSATVDSGHGRHGYWPISDGWIVDGDIGPARALLKRCGRLVAHVAAAHNVHADNVFDLTRMMRVPGSLNNKSGSNGEAPPLVTAHTAPGEPRSMADVDKALTKAGVHERDDDRAASRETVSPPADWEWAEQTCWYAPMLDGWPTDRPKNDARNPFIYSQHIRLECLHRLGCITEADHTRGRQILADLLTELVHTTEPRREPRKFEIDDMIEYGTAKAASKTDDEARAELGNHTHDDEQQPEPPPEPAPPVPLDTALAVFRKWLHIDDPAPVLAVAAAVIANTHRRRPGVAADRRTTLRRQNRDPRHPACTCPTTWSAAAVITEAALLSGTAKRDRAKNATGGLLRQIGEFGILLAKDFTSVLSQNHDTAKPAMAALREIYDGRWDRPVGTDGGKTLHWHGKCGFIGGVTPSYDRYSTIVNTLGDRFLLLRLPEVDAAKQAQAALKAAQHEQKMRAELADSHARTHRRRRPRPGHRRPHRRRPPRLGAARRRTRRGRAPPSNATATPANCRSPPARRPGASRQRTAAALRRARRDRRGRRQPLDHPGPHRAGLRAGHPHPTYPRPRRRHRLAAHSTRSPQPPDWSPRPPRATLTTSPCWASPSGPNSRRRSGPPTAMTGRPTTRRTTGRPANGCTTTGRSRTDNYY